MYKNILLPTDGSELSILAIKQGMALAKTLGARVTGFHARSSLPYEFLVGLTRSEPGDLEDQKRRLELASEEYLDAISMEAKRLDVAASVFSVASDSPYEAIIEAATREGCDLICMASHGRRGVSGVVLGSETQKVLTHCTIPVLVTR